jgi:uncharacterized protein (TIGR02646 family)
MVRINFQEPAEDPSWQIWRNECQGETINFISSVQSGDSNNYTVSNLYKKENIRDRYFFNDDFKAPFWRKCAYCEESVASQNGDVEHFRPKRRVSDDNYKPIQNHKGYYWLAYEWTNLLPSCLKCNQRRKWEKENGIFYVGKQDRFPLEQNTPRISSHLENIDDERPLLINPLLEDPENHLEVQLKTGIMLYKTIRGEKCIEIFGLNIRDDLRDGRKATIERVNHLLSKYFVFAENEDSQNAVYILKQILEFVYGQKRFSLAARCFLKRAIGDDYIVRLEERLASFENLLSIP